MRIAHLSRRLLVKAALAGAAGTLIPRTAIGAGPTGGEAQPVANNASLSSLTLSEAAELVHSKKISPVELTKACLGRIEQLNPKLNAFITVTADSALVNARAAEAKIQRGRWKGPLHGIPIALKDLDTAGVRTTAASGLFKDRVPTQSAEVVRRLRSAGPCFWARPTCTSSPTAAVRPSVTSVRLAIPGRLRTVQAAQPENHVNLSRFWSSDPDQKEGPSFMQRLVAKQKARFKTHDLDHWRGPSSSLLFSAF